MPVVRAVPITAFEQLHASGDLAITVSLLQAVFHRLVGGTTAGAGKTQAPDAAICRLRRIAALY